MTISIGIVLIVCLMILTSCAQNEMPPSSPPDLTGSKLQLTLNETELFDLLELTSIDTSTTWRDLDTLYREQISKTNSRDLKSNNYIFMVGRKNFMEEGDRVAFEYYAAELEKIDFNINLNTIVSLIEKLSPVWGKFETARYAKAIYDKNMKFWNEHFPGKTSYLEKNSVALEELKVLCEN